MNEHEIVMALKPYLDRYRRNPRFFRPCALIKDKEWFIGVMEHRESVYNGWKRIEWYSFRHNDTGYYFSLRDGILRDENTNSVDYKTERFGGLKRWAFEHHRKYVLGVDIPASLQQINDYLYVAPSSLDYILSLSEFPPDWIIP